MLVKYILQTICVIDDINSKVREDSEIIGNEQLVNQMTQLKQGVERKKRVKHHIVTIKISGKYF